MKYLIILLVSSLLLSCSVFKKSDDIVKKSKEDNTSIAESSIIYQLHDIWVLEKISKQKIEEISTFTKRPQLEIFVKEMRVEGNDGCNQFSGSIKELNGVNILFGPLMSTRIACEDMNISRKFNVALSKINSYRKEALKLFLLDKNNVELLQFQKID